MLLPARTTCGGGPALKTVVDVSVPVLVCFTMVVVGMELTPDDFRRVARRPWTVAAATTGQFVLLPAIGWVLVRCLNLQPAIARGVLLVAACPSGPMANVYTHLGRANVALSVTLTAVSCLAAVLSTPLALTALAVQFGESAGFPVPLAVLAGQLLLLLVLPVLAGMVIRRRRPDITRRHGRALLGLGIAALAALLAVVIVREAEHFVGALTDIAAAVTMLTILALLVGLGVGWACRIGAGDRFALGMVFVVRNVGIATALAVTTLGQLEFAVFATAYFLSQVPLLVAAVILFRVRHRLLPGTTGGAEGP